jgi:hypothetical protein
MICATLGATDHHVRDQTLNVEREKAGGDGYKEQEDEIGGVHSRKVRRTWKRDKHVAPHAAGQAFLLRAACTAAVSAGMISKTSPTIP